MDDRSQLDRVEAAIARVEAQLVLLSARLSANPIELVQAVGAAVAQAQGYDRPQVAPESGIDLIQTPGLGAVMEPWNETFEREQPDWSDDGENQSWWADMTGGERPVGELDSEGP